MMSENTHENAKNYKKFCSHELDAGFTGLLELNDEILACWMKREIKILKFCKTSLDSSKSFPIKARDYTFPIQVNDHLIFQK